MTMKSCDNAVEHGREEERERQRGVKWRSLHSAALFLIGERLAERLLVKFIFVIKALC